MTSGVGPPPETDIKSPQFFGLTLLITAAREDLDVIKLSKFELPKYYPNIPITMPNNDSLPVSFHEVVKDI